MEYISTRGGAGVSAGTAILKGIADDGGLYVPSSFPVLTKELMKEMIEMEYYERAAEILSMYLTDYTKEEILEYAEKAYSRFDGDPAPVIKIEDIYLLELFHGPTSAFKDIALTILPYLMHAARVKSGEKGKTLILVATSGDTGKAALEGFKDVEGTEIVVLYPAKGVSELQKLQMQVSEGENVHVIGISGNFDEAQTLVKNIFNSKEANEKFKKLGYSLSSANSINWGRLVPQIVYYISAYLDMLGCDEIKWGEKINVVVPTGNFGNILAAYYAMKMGLPIKKLIVASNSNNVLTDFFNDGKYDANRTFHKTISPSMDILVSSNLERLLFEFAGRDPKIVKKWMEELKTKGEYTIDKAELAKKLPEFVGYMSSEEDTKDGILAFYDMTDYVLDPHTAVAVNACYDYQYDTNDKTKTLVVSTASPYKFSKDVFEIITGKKEPNAINAMKRLYDYVLIDVPSNLLELDMMEILHDIEVDTQDAEKTIFSVLKK
ncbi:MAG: threonine synthase [Clostridiales bacterium]|jgi:threonine synthase|nr:threonine synthase [Clostridiales bacterium]